MKGLIADPIDWVPIREKKKLKAITSIGFIEIECFKRQIIATDNWGATVATTYNVSESGLQWLKKQCRGWRTHPHDTI